MRRNAIAELVVYASGTDLESGNPLVTVHSLSRQIQRFALFVTLAQYDSALVPTPYAARRGSGPPTAARSRSISIPKLRWHDGSADHGARRRLHDRRGARPGDRLLARHGSRERRQRRRARRLDGDRSFQSAPAVVPAHSLRAADPAVASARVRRRAATCDARRSTSHPVGNGPFRFVERRAGERWVFRAKRPFPAIARRAAPSRGLGGERRRRADDKVRGPGERRSRRRGNLADHGVARRARSDRCACSTIQSCSRPDSCSTCTSRRLTILAFAAPSRCRSIASGSSIAALAGLRPSGGGSGAAGESARARRHTAQNAASPTRYSTRPAGARARRTRRRRRQARSSSISSPSAAATTRSSSSFRPTSARAESASTFDRWSSGTFLTAGARAEQAIRRSRRRSPGRRRPRIPRRDVRVEAGGRGARLRRLPHAELDSSSPSRARRATDADESRRGERAATPRRRDARRLDLPLARIAGHLRAAEECRHGPSRRDGDARGLERDGPEHTLSRR